MFLKSEFPSTWNEPFPRSVTAGAVTPPRALVKVWRLPLVATAALVVAALA